MRREFCQVSSYSAARRLCPWAAKIAQCVMGYMAFESIDDYRQWIAQK